MEASVSGAFAGLLSIVQDRVVRIILALMVAGLFSMAGGAGWMAYEMRMARGDLRSHTGLLPEVMAPTNRFVGVFLEPQPNSRSKEPMIYKWIADFERGADEISAVKNDVKEVKSAVERIETKVDRLLDPKGKKP